MRIPGTLLVTWLVRPWPIKPAPIRPTRMGLPSASRLLSALSIMIMTIPSGCSTLDFSAGQCHCRMTHARLQLALLLCQQLPAFVFIGDDGDGQRPLEPQPGVVVHQPALAARGIKFSHLIAGFCLVAQHLVPVGEALGDVECAGIVFAQLN